MHYNNYSVLCERAQLMCTCILVLLRVSDIQFLEKGNKDLYTYMYRLHKSIQNAKKVSFTAIILSG